MLKKWKSILSLILAITFIIPYFNNVSLAQTVPERNNLEKYTSVISNDQCRLFYINACKTPVDFGNGITDIDEALQNWRDELPDATQDIALERLSILKSACSSLSSLTEEEFKQKIEFLLNTQGGESCLSFLGITYPSSVNWTQGSALPPKTDSCPIESIEKFNLGDFLNSPIDALMAGLPALLTSLITAILKIAVKVLLYFIVPNATTLKSKAISYTGYTVNNEFVVDSWTMIRDLANVALMLILFVIALGIMLRRSEFKNYQALIYLVVVAILLNFSLVICGMLIDISNFFTVFFLNSGNIQNLECTLVMTIQRVSNIFNQGSMTWWQYGISFVTKALSGGLTALSFLFGGPLGAIVGAKTGGWLSGLVSNAAGIKNPFPFAIVISKMLGLIVSIVFLGQMIGLLFYVLGRILMLWGLSIVSPLAFVCYILPQTKGIYKKWWQYFSGLLINLPLLCAAMFFILKLMNDLSKHANDLMKASGSNDAVPAIFGYTIMIIALSQSLLIAASALNVKNTAKAAGWIKGAAIAGTAWAFNTGSKELKTRVYNSESAKTAVEEISKVPVIGGFARNLSKKMSETTASSIGAGYKEASKITPSNYDSQYQLLKQYTVLGKYAEALGVARKMKENGPDSFAFIPSDLYTKHPDATKIIDTVMRKNKASQDTKEYDDLKNSQIYTQFEKNPDGSYKRSDVKKVIDKFAVDPSKYRGLDLSALLSFLSNNNDENGMSLKNEFETFFDKVGITYDGAGGIIRKSKVDKLDGFLSTIKSGMNGKSFFSKLSKDNLDKVVKMYNSGKLSLLSGEHYTDLQNAAAALKTETQLDPKFGNAPLSPTIIKERIQNTKPDSLPNLMKDMLDELRDMNRNKNIPSENIRETNRTWLDKLNSFSADVKKNITDSFTVEQKDYHGQIQKETELFDKPKEISVSDPVQKAKEIDTIASTLFTLLSGKGPVNVATGEASLKSLPSLEALIESLKNITIKQGDTIVVKNLFEETIAPQIETINTEQLANLFNNLPEEKGKQLIQTVEKATGKKMVEYTDPVKNTTQTDFNNVKGLSTGSTIEKEIYNKYFHA